MHMAHRATMDELAVLGMHDQSANFHAAALVHLVAGDNANELSFGHVFLVLTARRERRG
jgi:hypothetical protein